MQRFRLNRAQRALWWAQQLIGENVPLSIAQYVELRGPLDPDLAATVADEVAAELGMSTSRLHPDSETPSLCIDDHAVPTLVHEVSMVTADAPHMAALNWMSARTSAPLPLDGPLMECVLIAVGVDHWMFYARAHHILLDGFAAALLLRHIAYRYHVETGHIPRRDAPPQPQSLQAILDHETGYLGSTREMRDRAYWSEVFSRFPEPYLLSDHPHPVTTDRHIAGIVVDDSSTNRLRAVADAARVPPVSAMVASASRYLARLRDRPSVPLTLATSARTSAALRAAPGTMSNLLPIVVADPLDSDGADQLRAVTRTIGNALRHQQFRYEEMLRLRAGAARGEVGLQVLAHMGPVLNVVPKPPPIEFGDNISVDLHVLSTGPVRDVNLNIYPGGTDNLRIEVEVNATAHTEDVASGVLAGIMSSLRDLTTVGQMPGAVHAHATATSGDPGVVAARRAPAGTVGSLGEAYLRHRNSPRRAVVDAGTSYTHRQIADKAAGIVAVLAERTVRPGDVVAIHAARSADSIAAAWAVAAAGLCALPIDRALPTPRVRHLIGDCSPAVILTTGPGLIAGAVDLAKIAPGDGTTLGVVGVPAGAPAYVLYTSGSTGRPKGVLVAHRGIAELVAEINENYGLDAESVVAHCASPGFDTSIVEMLAAATVGATLAVLPPDVRGGTDLGAFLIRHTVTHLFITPAALATISPDQAPSVTHLIVGGDVCPPELIRAWARGRTVRCAYGPTETTCSVTMTDPINPDLSDPSVPLGNPMRGVRLMVLDRRLRPVPVGADGDLYIAGPSVGLGYHGRPAATAPRYVASLDGDGERMHRTGDRVRRTFDGGLRFLGRDDDQVKIRGIRVEPAETDAAILATGLARACATVVGGPADRRRLDTYVIPAHGVEPGQLPQLLRRRLLAEVPAALVPTAITVLEALPLTTNNKVDRDRLPTPDPPPRSEYRAATTRFERQTVAAFESALGFSPIGVDDDFFDLAGDSLSATAVVADVNRALGTHLGVRDVFVSATPRLLAESASAGRPGDPMNGDPGDEGVRSAATPIRLAPAQQNVFSRRNEIDHLVPFVITVPVRVSPDVVTATMGALLERHEMLRSITSDDGYFVVDPTAIDRKWQVDTLTATPDDWARRYLHRPIDVAHRYPFRVGVAAGADGSTHVAVCFHHLAVDGVSLGVLVGDLTRPVAHDAGDAGDRARYPEYALVARRRADDRRENEIAHFAAVLGPSRRLRLPTDGDACDTDGARVRLPLASKIWAGIEATARKHRMSSLTVLRAALADLLASRTGDDVIHIGALVSGRDDARWRDVVGMFVNTVCVPCPVSPTRSATLAAVHRAENDAFAHASTAFTDVVAGLGADGRHHPLFQVMLTVDDALHPDAYHADAMPGGVTVTPLPVDVSRCDLHVSVVPPTAEQDGHVEILYPAQRYSESMMHDLVRSYDRMVSRYGGI